MSNRNKKKTQHLGKFLGGYVPHSIEGAIEEWMDKDPERTKARFIREAAREKLHRDGIPLEQAAA